VRRQTGLLALAVGVPLLAARGLSAQTPAHSAPPPSSAATPAGVPAEAAALLSKAASVYADGSAHAAAFTQIYTPAGFATSKRESGTVWIQSPQRLRFDYQAPEAKVFTYDAGEGRFFSPEDKQLTIRKLSADEQARLPLVFLKKPDELGERYAIQVDGSKGVLLKPKAADADFSWLRLAVSPAGAVDGLSYEDPSGNRTEFRFESWRTEKPRPPADYRITGPKGTRIVEN
jgi:outer membrane lipoprotein-sorting protein